MWFYFEEKCFKICTSWIEEARLRLTFHCISEARMAYVGFSRGQLDRPRVIATAGRLNAQCFTMSESTVCAREGSVIEMK